MRSVTTSLGETHQDILVILPHHQDDPLGLRQVRIVDHVQTLWGILLVGLTIIGTLKWSPQFLSICEVIWKKLENFRGKLENAK